MKEADIRKYAALMQELGLTGLEITEENQRVRLERSVTVVREAVESSGRETDLQTIGTGASGAPGGAGVIPTQNSDYISVTSPIVGVFYAAPAENADPFVSIGDYVEKGKTLCIIEAMKLMNEIPAEEGGTIEAICVTNGQMVEYGTELFRMRR